MVWYASRTIAGTSESYINEQFVGIRVKYIGAGEGTRVPREAAPMNYRAKVFVFIHPRIRLLRGFYKFETSISAPP